MSEMSLLIKVTLHLQWQIFKVKIMNISLNLDHTRFKEVPL